MRHVLGDPDFAPGDESGFFVAERGGRIVGFARAIIRRWPNDTLGLEPSDGWIPYLAVDPTVQRSGVGRRLLGTVLQYFIEHNRLRVWVCGTTTSAPGSIVPGVDRAAYPRALSLLRAAGFIATQSAFSMARCATDFDVQDYHRKAWDTGRNVEITDVSASDAHELLGFVAAELPGAWCLACRGKIQEGRLDEMLLARTGGAIVGYCQWSGEHFGPFGVAPASRNLRVGAKLFVEAMRRIREANGRHVWFNWADENAKRFYDRFGFAVTREFCVLRKDLG